LQHAPDHYATLGLDRGCTTADIRAAYRSLAKRYHPDVNPVAPEETSHIAAINSAHEVLRDPARRRQYDSELERHDGSVRSPRSGKIERNIAQDVHLRIDEFLRGATRALHVNDPANAGGPETYQLEVPPGTAPGARFRLPRTAPTGGFIVARLRVSPGGRFKARGSDLRCDLRISAKRAADGGREMISGPKGRQVAVVIPARVKRGELVTVQGDGLPKARGGSGDLIVRVLYRPEVRVSRTSAR
jgi:curved DNA-binding protein